MGRRSLLPLLALLLVAAVQPGHAAGPGDTGAYTRNFNVPYSHGHYCGVGNSQAGEEPVDALDRACMEHDACANVPAGLPVCTCHRALIRAASAVAADPEESDTIRALATNIATVIGRVPCPDDEAGGPSPPLTTAAPQR